MKEWKPETVEYVKQLVERGLFDCDEEQLAVFKTFAVQPYNAPIMRYGNEEIVVVIARNGNEVIYFEDVDDGFNVSPTDSNGEILEHWCNQDDLKFALDYWIEGRGGTEKVGPAQPID